MNPTNTTTTRPQNGSTAGVPRTEEEALQRLAQLQTHLASIERLMADLDALANSELLAGDLDAANEHGAARRDAEDKHRVTLRAIAALKGEVLPLLRAQAVNTRLGELEAAADKIAAQLRDFGPAVADEITALCVDLGTVSRLKAEFNELQGAYRNLKRGRDKENGERILRPHDLPCPALPDFTSAVGALAAALQVPTQAGLKAARAAAERILAPTEEEEAL